MFKLINLPKTGFIVMAMTINKSKKNIANTSITINKKNRKNKLFDNTSTDTMDIINNINKIYTNKSSDFPQYGLRCSERMSLESRHEVTMTLLGGTNQHPVMVWSPPQQ